MPLRGDPNTKHLENSNLFLFLDKHGAFDSTEPRVAIEYFKIRERARWHRCRARAAKICEDVTVSCMMPRFRVGGGVATRRRRRSNPTARA